MARIALDAMGGDHAPHAPIAGALYALGELDPAHTIQLVGQTEVIEHQVAILLKGECAAAAPHRSRLSVVEAPDTITMHDQPSAVLRTKVKSSMAVGLKLQAEGKSDAFVSAGNTGAQMAASARLLGLHAGVDRPAICTLFPTAREFVVVLDSGANVDCSAEQLVQFAYLGSVYAEDVLGRQNPVIGLLSIGEESEKGNAVVKEAHQRLKDASLNFQGNIEGRDIPKGASERGPIDVVVCDGFVGNVLLKFYESVAPMIFGLLKAKGVDVSVLGAAGSALDYASWGGAPLLGVKGVSMICHGKSSARAIKNAIKAAVRAIESQMSEHIRRRLADTLVSAR